MGDKIIIEQLVPAGPERVFGAWISPEALAGWWWPHLADTTIRLDARPGGSFLIQSQTAGIGVEGEFVEVDPPRSLTLTWRWLTQGVAAVEETVEVSFIPAGTGTFVRVTHELDDIVDDGHHIRRGWTDVLTRLSERFA